MCSHLMLWPDVQCLQLPALGAGVTKGSSCVACALEDNSSTPETFQRVLSAFTAHLGEMEGPGPGLGGHAVL